MTLRSWIRKVFTRPVTRTVRNGPGGFRPTPELLESRLAPATVTNASAYPITVGDFLKPPEWSDVTPLAFHSPTGPTDPEPFQATTVGAPDDNSSLYVTLDPVGQDIFLLYDYAPLTQAFFAANPQDYPPGTTVATVSFPLTLTNADGSTQSPLIEVLIEVAQNSIGGGGSSTTGAGSGKAGAAANGSANQGFPGSGGFAVFVQFQNSFSDNGTTVAAGTTVPASQLGFAAAATFAPSPLSSTAHLQAELGVPLDIPTGFASANSPLPSGGENNGSGDFGYSPLPQYWGVSVNNGGDPPASSALYSISPSGKITADSSANVTQVATVDLPAGNAINLATLANNGILKLAILSTPTFDATTIIPASIQLWDANVAYPWPYATPIGSTTDANGLILTFEGIDIKSVLSGATDDLAVTGSINGGGTVAGTLPVTVIADPTFTVLHLFGGNTSNDQVQINPAGPSNTGSTGVTIHASLKGVNSQITYGSFSAIYILLGNGNDNIQEANSLTIPIVVDPGNGNDNIHLGNTSNSFVVLGNGNDHVQIATGPNPDNFELVSLGNGNDQVQIGDGSNDTVTAGSGRDQVQIGGNNNSGLDSFETVTLGGGNDQVQIGTGGSDAVSLGDGNDNVQLSNGPPMPFGPPPGPPAPPPGPPAPPVGYGNDSVTMGNGNDQVQIGDGSFDTVTMGAGRDQVNIGSNNNSGLDSFETVTLGSGNDQVQIGTGGFNFVSLGDGNDVVQIDNGPPPGPPAPPPGPPTPPPGPPGPPAPVVYGNDTVTLGNGNDQVQIGDGSNDTVTVGAGHDQVQIGSKNNSGLDSFETVTVAAGNDNIQLGDGSFDAVTALGGNDQVQIGSNNKAGLDFSETVTLGGGNDQVQIGDGGSDNLSLGGGNDQVQIGSGNNSNLDSNDIVSLGGGNDQVHIGNGTGNTVTSTNAHDNVQFDSGTHGTGNTFTG